MIGRLLLVFLLATTGAAAAAPVPAPAPPLLDAAIKKWVADEDYWAYSQEVKVRNGSKVETRLERFDPSQPDDYQWTLIQIDGKSPTPAQSRSWRRDKDREVRRRTRLPIAAYFDFARATVKAETATSVRYEVPLRKEAYRRVPLDKLGVSISVDKARQELEHFSAGLLEDIRLGMGLARVTDFAVDIRFAQVDPKYAPQPASIKASGRARVAWLFTRSGEVDVTWRNFQRVVPYKQRVSVEIGELRALNF